MVFNGGQSAGFPFMKGGIHEKVVGKVGKEDFEKGDKKTVEETFDEIIDEAFTKAFEETS